MVIAGLLALSLPGGSSVAEAQQVFKIAAGVPLTGPLAKQGQEVANAVKLAVEEWNKKGGVLGKKIEVLEADDQGNPQVGVAAAEKVAADAAVLGAVPLIFASGAGAEARLALGWIIVGGLGLATLFTLFLTPVMYRILAPLSKPRAAETQRLVDELEAARSQ